MQGGVRIVADISSEDTTTDVKGKIKQMIGTPVDKQLITFGDTKIEGDNKQNDFGVKHGSTALMTNSSNTQEKCS